MNIGNMFDVDFISGLNARLQQCFVVMLALFCGPDVQYVVRKKENKKESDIRNKIFDRKTKIFRI